MADPNPARLDYHDAIIKAERYRDDPNNRGDKSVHWGTVHTLLVRHAPCDDKSTCQASDCGEPWPCGTVTGAQTDLAMGPAGW